MRTVSYNNMYDRTCIVYDVYSFYCSRSTDTRVHLGTIFIYTFNSLCPSFVPKIHKHAWLERYKKKKKYNFYRSLNFSLRVKRKRSITVLLPPRCGFFSRKTRFRSVKRLNVFRARTLRDAVFSTGGTLSETLFLDIRRIF